MLRMEAWQSHPQVALQQRLSDVPQRVQLHGIIADDPATRLLHGQPSVLCVIDIRHVRVGQRWQRVPGRLRATLHGARCTPLAYGDEVLLEGRWSRVPPPGNPGQYDWRAALARQRIHGLLRVVASDSVVILRERQGVPWYAAACWLRHRWERLIQEAFAPRDAGLLLSLLLGERVALEQQLKDAFTETGTIHLLVISGFNVGLVAALLELCFRVFNIPWRVRLVLSAISLGGYMILTGLQPPVVRATLMAWVVLGAYAIDRLVSWPNTLAAAALVILWINPSQLFDAGFQLSFGAVASLLLFAAPWAAWLEQRLHGVRPAWFRRYLALGLSTTSAVWVGLAPVLAWYFHLVAPMSVIANLLIAPLMSALVYLGTGLLLCATVWPAVMSWAHGSLVWLLELVVRCVTMCHLIPGGYWCVARPSLLLLVGYYMLLGVGLARHRVGFSTSRVLICWMAAGVLWLWAGIAGRVLETRWLRLDVLDVGHGDCLVLRTPGGHTLIVDAGTEEAGQYRVGPFLRHAGVRTIDALILTHTDADHLGGAIPLLEQFRVRRLLTNGVQGDTMSAHRVHQLAAAHALNERVLSTGMRITDGSALSIEVLHPPRGLVPERPAQSNDNSLVLRITLGKVSALLCGDLEERGIPWLLRAGFPLRSTLLKVPHHGSRLHRAGAKLFAQVHPQVALLSVGRLHHLPARETVEALKATGAGLHITRDEGAIQMRIDGTHLEVRAFKRPGVIERILVEPPLETHIVNHQRSQ